MTQCQPWAVPITTGQPGDKEMWIPIVMLSSQGQKVISYVRDERIDLELSLFELEANAQSP